MLRLSDFYTIFTLNTWNSLLLFKAVQKAATLISSFVFLDLSLCPWHLLSFFFSGPSRTSWVARKAREERPKGECLPTRDKFHIYLPTVPLFSTTQSPSCVLQCTLMMPWLCLILDYATSTALIWRTFEHFDQARTDIFGLRSIIQPDLVCFGSGFDQAVLLRCQGPFVKLESKQPWATKLSVANVKLIEHIR